MGIVSSARRAASRIKWSTLELLDALRPLLRKRPPLFVPPGAIGASELLVYVDPGYAGPTGHFAVFADRMAQEARRRGVALVHLAGRTLATRETPEVVRVFAHGAGRPAAGLARRLTERAFLRDLEAALRIILEAAAPGARLVAYMYTALPSHALAVSRIAARIGLRPERFRADLVLLHAGDFDDASLAAALQGVSWAHIEVHGDTEESAARLARLTGHAVRPLPIPLWRADEILAPPTVREPGAPIRVGFLGEASPIHGYPLVAALATEAPLPGAVLVARHHRFPHHPAAMDGIHARFRARGDGLEHLDGPLTREGYRALLDSCDIVLIPHDAKHYAGRSSGQTLDALARGKVLVVTGGTWMESAMRAYGAGVAFAAGDEASFRTAVREAVARYPELRALAAARRLELPAAHSVEALFDALNLPRSA